VDWIQLAQDRNQWWSVVNMVLYLWTEWNFWTIWVNVSFSRRILLRVIRSLRKDLHWTLSWVILFSWCPDLLTLASVLIVSFQTPGSVVKPLQLVTTKRMSGGWIKNSLNSA
jgi:hypothetical protein